MKTFRILPAFIFIFLLIYNIYAQQEESRYWTVEEIEIKEKRSRDFESSLKEIKLSLEFQQYPYNYLVCKSTQNRYYIFTPLADPSDIDPMKAEKANAWELLENKLLRSYKKCIATTREFVIKDLPEYNYLPEHPRLVWDDVKFAVWELHTIKAGMDETYLQNLKKFQALKEHSKYNDPSFIFQSVEGFDQSTMILMSYGLDKTDWANHSSKLWESIGDQGSALFESLFLMIQNQEFIDFNVLREISYNVIPPEDNL